jgi:hypothetical protein
MSPIGKKEEGRRQKEEGRRQRKEGRRLELSLKAGIFMQSAF